MSRARRIVSAAGVGVVTQVVTMLVGLWFTRFALGQIGQHSLGLWLLGLQVTLYLGLLDLGVVGILPRDVAVAAGRGAQESDGEAVARTVAESARLVLWQTPVVAAAAAAMWFAAPSSWVGLHRPLVVILAVFVVAFPLRTLQAVLQGLQDQAYIGLVQFAAWAVGTATAVGLLLAGKGLYALVASWAIVQLAPPLAHWARLRLRHPGVLPRRLPRLSATTARAQLGRSVWVSIGQLTHLAVTGFDVLVIGIVLGPAAVVPYVCTGKLLAVLAAAPVTVAGLSGPAIGDVRVREGPERLAYATSALGLAVLWLSGAVAVTVLAGNEAFVGWWVGTPQFAGHRLTAAIVLTALVRHWAAVFGQAAFYGGHERVLGLNGIVESGLVVGLTVVLVRSFGVIGAPLASLAGVACVALPFALRLFAADAATRAGWILRQAVPWGWRMAVAVAASLLLARAWRPATPMGLGLIVLGVWSLYAALMLPLLRRQPLRGYLVLVTAPAWPRLGALLAGPRDAGSVTAP